jgi:hypothetical protein
VERTTSKIRDFSCLKIACSSDADPLNVRNIPFLEVWRVRVRAAQLAKELFKRALFPGVGNDYRIHDSGDLIQPTLEKRMFFNLTTIIPNDRNDIRKCRSGFEIETRIRGDLIDHGLRLCRRAHELRFNDELERGDANVTLGCFCPKEGRCSLPFKSGKSG